MTIENRGKIGIGTGDWTPNAGAPLNDVERAGFAWHYDWLASPLKDIAADPVSSSFIPMVWDETCVTAQNLGSAKLSGATTLLGFNEPDNPDQSRMTVDQALALWPQLEATGMRLGSPAATQYGTLGAGSWLGRFMTGAESKDLKVDFITTHYYSQDKDVGSFERWLEAVHAQYNKPIWVTEWALADWSSPSRFSAVEQAEFARAGTEMMDDLPFVERHAWFAAYDGGDGWNLNSGVFDASGALTAVGEAFSKMNRPTPGAATRNELKVTVSGDHYQGAPQFEVEVDGVSAGFNTVTADHRLGQWQDVVISGDWAAGAAHAVRIKFLNDAWGGTDSTDRNLWVKLIEMDGHETGQETQLIRSGTAQMDSQVDWFLGDAPALDVITVRASGDSYQGNPNFSISVDGRIVEATNVVTSDRANDEWQTFTFTGAFTGGLNDKGVRSHSVGITFIEDAWGGTPNTDRNLYINAVTFNRETNTNNATYYTSCTNVWEFSV